jgi:CheY-like chemotaxis protein
MGSAHRFSILLVTTNVEEIKSVSNMIKRQFPFFFIVKTEEDALKIIIEKNIDVLLMGLNSLQENEIFYLHLLSAKKNIEKIIYRKIVLCSRDELREAFAICNKDVFDDYFVIRPLYDPYHILLRLRFIRRVRDNQTANPMSRPSINDLSNYFDKVASCQDSLDDLNKESFEKLLGIVSSSMKQMKNQIVQNRTLTDNNKQEIGSLIDTHTEKNLIKQVSEHQSTSNASAHDVVKDIADIALLKKERLQNPETLPIESNSNILILEDDIASRDDIKLNLESAGYHAQTSGSAMHAIQMMQTWKPDIVLIDLTLPDMSPLFVISSIKNDPGMSHTRIIVLAKAGDKDNAQEAMKMGVNEIMRKPLDRDMLIYKIKYNIQAIADAGQH